MTTDNAIHAEAAYRTARHAERAQRPGLRRIFVRIIRQPSGVAALFAAVRRAATADDAVRDILAAASVPTSISGRV
jgi:hypothetical protein